MPFISRLYKVYYLRYTIYYLKNAVQKKKTSRKQRQPLCNLEDD